MEPARLASLWKSQQRKGSPTSPVRHWSPLLKTPFTSESFTYSSPTARCARFPLQCPIRRCALSRHLTRETFLAVIIDPSGAGDTTAPRHPPTSSLTALLTQFPCDLL